MHLLHDARPLQAPNPSGVSFVTRELMDHLIEATPDWQHDCWTVGMNKTPLIVAKPARHIHVKIPSKLTALLDRIHLDFTHFTKTKADLLVMYNLDFIGTPRIPYAMLVHDISFLIEPHWFKWRFHLKHLWIDPRRQLTRAKHLFAVSETTKRDLMAYLKLPENRITVLPITSRPTKTIGQLPIELQNKKYVLAFDDGHPRKNIDSLLAAWQQFEKENGEVCLVLVGRKSTPANLKHVITFPWLEPETREAILKSASLFAYPSWYEGFGLPLHEAAEFGVPTLASSHSCIPETMPANTTLIPPTKPHLWLVGLRQQLSQARSNTPIPPDPNVWKQAAQMMKEKIEEMR